MRSGRGPRSKPAVFVCAPVEKRNAAGAEKGVNLERETSMGEITASRIYNANGISIESRSAIYVGRGRPDE